MTLANKVATSVLLQFGNAALVFLNQIVIIRFFGLAEYGGYQYAYALLMAAPTFLTLGLFNLAFDRNVGRRAIAPSIVVALVLAPAGLLFVEPKVVLASALFTISFSFAYGALADGRYVLRSLLGGGLLNLSVFVLVLSQAVSTVHSLLVVAASLSALAAIALAPRRDVNLRELLSGTLVTLRELGVGYYAIFAACGVLSNLTYVLPLWFTRYVLPPDQFGVVALGIALARMPFLFSGAIAGLVAKPAASGDSIAVCRLSQMLSTLGMCATALLALNFDIVLHVADVNHAATGTAYVALFGFVGATMWGAVDDIIWFTGNFRSELLFKMFNVGFTALSCLIVYLLELDIGVYLALLATSTICSCYLRYRFLRRRHFPLRVDIIALVALIVTAPFACFSSVPVSVAASVPIAAYACFRVWRPDASILV